MTLTIDQQDAKKLNEILNKRLNKKEKKGNLSKHFGKLKRNLDGLKYQLQLRENED